jgi:hypothetical protein
MSWRAADGCWEQHSAVNHLLKRCQNIAINFLDPASPPRTPAGRPALRAMMADRRLANPAQFSSQRSSTLPVRPAG